MKYWQLIPNAWEAETQNLVQAKKACLRNLFLGILSVLWLSRNSMWKTTIRVSFDSDSMQSDCFFFLLTCLEVVSVSWMQLGRKMHRWLAWEVKGNNLGLLWHWRDYTQQGDRDESSSVFPTLYFCWKLLCFNLY